MAANPIAVTPEIRKFYVYEHWRPDTGVCFYVGKGQGARAHSLKRTGRHKYVVNKLARLGFAPEVRIIKTDLTEAEAFALEVSLIASHGRKDAGTGHLINATCGGEGVSGRKSSTETKAKIAARLTGNKNFLGRVCSPEHRAKISAAHKGKGLTEQHKASISASMTGLASPFLGKQHSAETKAKMGAASAGRVHSKETRTKMSEAHRGVRFSAEHRANLVAAWKVRKEMKLRAQ